MLKHKKQTSPGLKEEIDSNIIIMGDCNTPLLIIDHSQKINKENSRLENCKLNKPGNIYRIFHPTVAKTDSP